jgi:salicylate hydroxylase
MLPMQGKVQMTLCFHVLTVTGSGAGLSIEDANVLGFAIRDFLEEPVTGLETFMNQYQAARLHRAHNAQRTSRQAADSYDLAGLDFEGKSYEECFPVLASKVNGRMTWLWKSDLEADWEAAKTGAPGES